MDLLDAISTQDIAERLRNQPPASWLASEQEAPTNWCDVRRQIVTVARAEEARWTRANGQKILESEPSQLPILRQYWLTVPTFSTAAAANAQAQLSAANIPDGEWSAAFICFVMHAAGVRRAHGFDFRRRHLNYIVGALRNRERSDRARPFWLVDHIELQREAIPEPGDLLAFNRPTDGGMTQHTYRSLRRQFWLGGNQNVAPRGSSHCSIVVGTATVGGQRRLETIGGNEGGSVTLRRNIPIDQSGGIANAQAHDIFGMIKLIAC